MTPVRILIATDGSDRSRAAVATGVALARALGARVIGFTAVAPYPYTSVGEHQPSQYASFQAAAAAEANDRLAVIEAAARAADLAYEVLMKQDDAPHRAILDTARDTGCDLIVMASHGRSGLGAVVLGSETQKVLAGSDRPVLVTR